MRLFLLSAPLVAPKLRKPTGSRPRDVLIRTWPSLPQRTVMTTFMIHHATHAGATCPACRRSMGAKRRRIRSRGPDLNERILFRAIAGMHELTRLMVQRLVRTLPSRCPYLLTCWSDPSESPLHPAVQRRVHGIRRIAGRGDPKRE